MTIDPNDPRLKAAELTEEEFLGELVIEGDNSADGMVEAYLEIAPWWNSLTEHCLLEAREGYSLHYDPRPRPQPLVFLGFGGDLVGVFESDTLTVHPDHRGKKLGRELILAGFAQAPWKGLKQRKVTKAGAASLLSAYRFVVSVTGN